MTDTPLDQDDVARLALATLALDLPVECRPGVVANLNALADHARRIEDGEAG